MLSKEEELKKEEDRIQKHTTDPIQRTGPGAKSPARTASTYNKGSFPTFIPASEKIDDYRAVLRSKTEKVIQKPVDKQSDKPQQQSTDTQYLSPNQPQPGRSVSPLGRSVSWKEKRDDDLKKRELAEAEKKEKEKERIAQIYKNKSGLSWKEQKELDEKKKKKKLIARKNRL